MTENVFFFVDQNNVTSGACVDVVGGKGFHLMKLMELGFKVPPGFVIPTGVFSACVDGVVAPFRQSLNDERRSVDEIEAVCVKIRDAIVSLTDSRHGLDNLIQEGLRSLGHPADVHYQYAVRSSATSEDGEDASFAGQYKTLLNVKQDGLISAVLQCWASYYSGAAAAYRVRQQDRDAKADQLAVVVQVMAPATSAGVLFTANPMTGDRRESVINASVGLGEKVVGGLVTPDAWRVSNAEGHSILHQDAVQSPPSLSTDQVMALTNTGQQLQMALGGNAPLDIEWAFVGAELVLLQSRPITTLIEPPAPPTDVDNPDQLLVYSSFAHHQGTMRCLTPLNVDVVSAFLCTPSVLITGIKPKDLMSFPGYQCVPAACRGWEHQTWSVRSPMDSAGAMEALSPTASKVFRHLKATEPTLRATRTSIYSTLKNATVFLSYVVPGIFHAAIWPASVEQQAAKQLARRHQYMSDPSCWRLKIYEQPDTDIRIMLNYFVPNLMFAGLGFQLLKAIAPSAQLSEEATGLMRAASENNYTVRMQVELWKIAEAHRDSLLLWSEQQSNNQQSNQQSKQQFESSSDAVALFLDRHPQLRAALDQWLDLYGCRGSFEIDISTPRYRDQPEQVLNLLRAFANTIGTERSASTSPIEKIKQSSLVAQKWLARCQLESKEKLKSTSILFYLWRWIMEWIRMALISFFFHRCLRLWGFREFMKFYGLFPIYGARMRALEMGEKLVKQNVITKKEDVFYLRMVELEQLVSDPKTQQQKQEQKQQQEQKQEQKQEQEQKQQQQEQEQQHQQHHQHQHQQQQDWKQVVKNRKEEMEREEKRKRVPCVLLSDGRCYYDGWTPEGAQADTKHGDMGVDSDGNRLFGGLGVSPGTVEGIAVVMNRSHPIPKLLVSKQQEPRILVTVGTDPSYGGAFLLADGLVCDIGGHICHGAILARELSLPAVVGVTGFTHQIRSGQRIRVDGNSGRVTLLD